MKFKNYRNSHTNEDKIYSRKNIADMSVREAFSRKDEIMAQHNSIGIPSEGELKSSPNAIWVDTYTRDDGTEVKGHWRSKPEGSDSNTNDNEVTGGAANVQEKELKKEEKDIPEMTKSAELQEIVAKNNPIANNYPEQEYYKISLNLDKIRKTGKVPEWMKEHNDIRTLDKIGNKELAEKIRKKVIESAKENRDQNTLNNPNNVFVITAKPNSNLTNLIINDSDFNQDLESKLQNIKNGKYENSSYSFVFKDNIVGQKDIDNKFSTNHTISKCDVHDVKLEQDGYISATIIDYYDFSPKGGFINNNANIQQQNGKLENYALVIPLRMKIKKRK